MRTINLCYLVPAFLILTLVDPGAAVGGQVESETVTVTRSCSSSIRLNVNTNNGYTTVLFNGEKVFSGKTSGKVLTDSEIRNCKGYAAVWDGRILIWQSSEEAASVLTAP